MDHLSAGNLGLFSIITERRKLRIYWPRPELLKFDWEGEEEEEAEERPRTTGNEDAVMISTH